MSLCHHRRGDILDRIMSGRLWVRPLFEPWPSLTLRRKTIVMTVSFVKRSTIKMPSPGILGETFEIENTMSRQAL